MSGWATAAGLAQFDGHRAAYIMPPRSRRGLARLTSKRLCCFGVMTVTSSFWAPAKALK